MELGAVALPVVLAELEHALGSVVDAVVEVRPAGLEGVVEDERAGLEGLFGQVEFLAAKFEGEDTGAGAGDGDLALGGVAEPAGARVVAAEDVVDGGLDPLGRDVTPEVL